MNKFTKLFEDAYWDKQLQTFLYLFIQSTLGTKPDTKELCYELLVLSKELKMSIREAVIPDDFKLSFVDIVNIYEKVLLQEYSKLV